MAQALIDIYNAAHQAASSAGVPASIFNLAYMGVKVGLGLGFAMIVTVVLIYVERKTWAYMQVRLGPMRT